MLSLQSSSWSSTLRQFSLSEIRKATNNFNRSLILRRGWSFLVHKGTYDDYDGTKKTVAIRSSHLELSSQEALTWFEKELEAWSQYRHKHVVSVIGFCQELPSTYIVVYEYMPNGSLANHLGTKITPTNFQLPWDQCLQICTDAARGLEYMHTSIIYSKGGSFAHGDVTLSNIMLDANCVAKISDIYYEPFREHEPAFLFDPEYQSISRAKQSSDVYAFGVLLVKVLSRKVSFDKEDKNLGIWFKKCIMDGTIHRIIHDDTKAQVSRFCLEAFVLIADDCLNNVSGKRPSFTQVVKKLELLMTPSSLRLCHRYTLQEIKDVTNNFKSNILGKGGEGTVYKGVAKTKTTVAVKRLKPERSPELEKEIKMLSNLDHPNLVSLVGYCRESDENILVYEFMCNGNLSKNLHGESSSLSWKQRLNICVGAANGLRYLHTGANNSRKGIIHRDIKPVNILLDENFNARISDFGLSKMGTQDQSNSEISTAVKGTRGYYAPEYQKYGKITRGIDVYAFGVVLTELLCRKKPWDREESFYPTENEKYGQWAKENIDPDLEGRVAPECLQSFTGILEKCLNKDPKRRPSMNDVVSVLEYAVECQEAWERHKSGGDFYLPCGEDRVVLYYSSSSPQHIKLRALLRSYKVQVDERDLQKDLYANDFKNVIFRENVDIRLPQLFVRGKYIGNVNETEKLHETGELLDILEAPRPKFICDRCGEAKKCDNCKQTKRFVHCKNCDALTEIWKFWENGGMWGGQLRSCLECDGNNQSVHLVELAPISECRYNIVLCYILCLVAFLCAPFSNCWEYIDGICQIFPE